jgi:two-component system chemotaxis response regulator CheB
VDNPGRDIVVVGASAGGVEALTRLVAKLPADLPAVLFIVLHIPPSATSVLPSILSRRGALPAHHATDEQPFEVGNIYVAPPDHHMLVDDQRIRVVRGPHENGHRPAVDPLFRSAAQRFGPRVTGVILSGALDDGTAGLLAVKNRGGATLVQDPDDALYPSMPESAIRHVDPDAVEPIARLAELIALLATTTPMPGAEAPVAIHDELTDLEPDPQPGMRSAFACPDCGGALWETDEGGLLRFRCRIGHEFTVNGLGVQQARALEAVLWSAHRALAERAAMSRRMAKRMEQSGRRRSAARYGGQAEEADKQAAVIRSMVEEVEVPQPTADEAELRVGEG